jgi:hypothetical protein
MDTIIDNLPVILIVAGLILLQFFLRRRRPEVGQQDMVQGLASEVRLNQAIAEVFHQQKKPRRFETVGWQRHKGKIDFLERSLQSSLSRAYEMIEDFNLQIASARKYKSMDYLAGVGVEKVKDPLAQSREGLEQWLLARTGSRQPPPRYPGLFEGLFGGRQG